MRNACIISLSKYFVWWENILIIRSSIYGRSLKLSLYFQRLKRWAFEKVRNLSLCSTADRPESSLLPVRSSFVMHLQFSKLQNVMQTSNQLSDSLLSTPAEVCWYMRRRKVSFKEGPTIWRLQDPDLQIHMPRIPLFQEGGAQFPALRALVVEAADVFQEQREGLLSIGMLCPGHTGSVSNLEKGKYFTILISGGSNENSSDIWILAALLVELFGEGLRGVAILDQMSICYCSSPMPACLLPCSSSWLWTHPQSCIQAHSQMLLFISCSSYGVSSQQ